MSRGRGEGQESREELRNVPLRATNKSDTLYNAETINVGAARRASKSSRIIITFLPWPRCNIELACCVCPWAPLFNCEGRHYWTRRHLRITLLGFGVNPGMAKGKVSGVSACSPGLIQSCPSLFCMLYNSQTRLHESMQPNPAATPPSSLWSPLVRSRYPASSLCEISPVSWFHRQVP